MDSIKELLSELKLSEKVALQEHLSYLILEERNDLKNKIITNCVSNCPICGSSNRVKYGLDKLKIKQRFKCKDCERVYSSTTGLSIHGIHDTKKWFTFLNMMFESSFQGLRKMAEKVSINLKTAFYWRHKILYGLQPKTESYNGIVEVDDLHFKFSEKGRIGLSEPRERGSDYHNMGDNDLSVKVLASADRVGNLQLDLVRIGRLQAIDLVELGKKLSNQSNIIVSDCHSSIKKFAKSIAIKHETFKASEHCVNKVIHVNTINQKASKLGTLINREMGGVATKYLNNYVHYFQLLESVNNKLIDVFDLSFKNNNATKLFKNREINYKSFLDNFANIKYKNPVKYG